ncbi:MAG: FG-GAP-like repeat-containing protein, partial [Chitinophagaceae bacterium]
MNKLLYHILTIGFFLFFGTTVNAQSTLNTFGFSNADAKAAVAYSLRKLSTDYIGFAIQVRRSSDNATQDIGFTSAGNLDTAALKTFVGSNNGFVTIWYDQSGNARNLTQTTTGSQPAIVNTGVIYRKSGSPTVFFDATDDGMLFTGTDYLTANGLAVNVVAGSNANDNLPRRAVQGTSNWVIGPHGNAHSWWAGDWNHQIATPWSTTMVERFTVIQTPTINTANTSFRNGTAVPCANNKSTQPGKLSLGASGGFAEPLNGFISEVVGFPYELLPSEIDLIENSQASYYTASITLGISNIKAATAYSLRKITADFAGFAIQVRRSSDNTTQDIGFTTAGNLDTAALKTFVGSNNGFVTIWYDQSGNARNLTQTTAGSQPAIINAGVIYRRSGSPTVFFDATDDGMLFTGTAYLTTNGLSVNIVAGSNSNDNSGRRAVQGTSNWVIGPHGNAHSWWSGGWNHQIATPWSTTLVERFTVIQPTSNANTSFRNGIAVPSANNKSTQPGILSLGASGGFAEPLNGFISEVVSYPTELTTTQTQSIETSQASYYSIQSTVAPTITSFTPLTAKPGDPVTLTGTDFNTIAANNIVFFGATRATVTAGTATSVTVTVPTGATFAPITLLNTSNSFAAFSNANFTPIYSPAKTGITATDFQAKQDFTTGFNPYFVAIGDLDGDGKPDLAVANIFSNNVSVYRNTSTSGSIGAGSFAAKVDFATGSYPNSVAIGDLDGDGKLDLAVANQNSNNVSVFRNTSTSGSIDVSSFAAGVDFATGTNPVAVAIGDLDGDGKPDLAVANFSLNLSSNSVSVYRNTATSGSISSGSFAAKVDFATGDGPRSVAIGDLDGDGKPDLVVANAFSNTVSVYRNTATSGSISS